MRGALRGVVAISRATDGHSWGEHSCSTEEQHGQLHGEAKEPSTHSANASPD